MFKSSFAKHICAFVLIVIMSFLVLSGIIGTLVRGYAEETRKEKLGSILDIVIEYVNDEAIVNIETAATFGLLPKTVETIVKTDPQYDILIANENFEIVLSTVGEGEDVQSGKNLGTLSLDNFKSEGGTYIHSGNLSGFLPEKSLVLLKKIEIEGEVGGYVAAKLIDDLGFKGLSVGGAMVSTKHAGFIVNTGNATASDVLSLEEKIKAEVFKSYGITLEREVRYVK